MIEFAEQCIDDTILSVKGALISTEAEPEPFDTEQMSGYQELMSVRQTLLTLGYGLMSVVPVQKAILDIHETFNPDQLSVVKALKSSAQLFYMNKGNLSLCALSILLPFFAMAQERGRARDFGIEPGIFQPGKFNAITDVEGDSVRT